MAIAETYRHNFILILKQQQQQKSVTARKKSNRTKVGLKSGGIMPPLRADPAFFFPLPTAILEKEEET